MRWWSLLAAAAASLLGPAAAVFADDAYQSDYHIPLLGHPQPGTTFFHQPHAKSKASLLYTLSDRAVLGAVNPKDGAVVWRQQLPGGANGSHLFLRAGEGQDTVVSAADDHVAAWAAGDGKLAWSRKLERGVVKDLEILETSGAENADGVKDVLLLGGSDYGVLQRLDGKTGEVKWEYVDKSGDPVFQVSASATDVFLVSLHSTLLGGFKINVASIDPSTGQRNSHYSLSTEGDITEHGNILHVGANSAFPLIAWTDKSHKNLKVNILGGKHIVTLPFDSNSEEVKAVYLHAPHRSNALAHFLVHVQTATGHWAEVYHVDLKKDAVSKAYSLPKVAGKGAFSSSSVDANVFFARVTESEAVLVSSQSHGILERHPLVEAPLRKQPLHVVAEVAIASSSSYPTRAALLTEDGEWTLLRNGDALWSRPEYLAHAVTATFAELLKEQTLEQELETESHQNPISAFVHRITRHVQMLRNLPSVIQNPSQASDEASSGINTATADKFGLVKVVVLALPRRRLIAFDTSRPGIPLWTISLATSQDRSDWNGVRVFAADPGFVEIHETRSSAAYVINTLTGQVIAEPDLAANPDKLTKASDIFNVQVDDHGLRGYTGRGAATPAWRLNIPPQDRIVSLASRLFTEVVASIGKALGDRRVLYKYLNPNLALLGTINDATDTLTVTILDTTSGQVLDTATHLGVDSSRPVTSVISENWFAYSFSVDGAAQAASRGQQLVIGEMYESSLPDDRGSLGASSNYSALGGPGGELAAPHVVVRSYQVPEGISGMTVTQTRQGITSRDLLITLADSKGIVAVPRHILDARRPVGREPTKDEQAEGLMPYTPTLDFDPKWYLNHQRELLGIKNVITTPSLLESTSLVFAYGLDVFGTRVSPSFTFDILGKGFNKAQMLLTVAALGVAVVLVAPFVARKQINQRWQIS